MKAVIAQILVGLTGCLLAGSSPAATNPPLPRLFPDLVTRYRVGDTNAVNPIDHTEGPKNITAADLNGDGRADLITANLDGSISVLLGQASRELGRQILVPATGLLQSNSLRAVVTADFNHDGKLDVAVGDIARGGIVLLLGYGDGTLMPFARLNLGPVRALARADFNGDSHADLLVGGGPDDCEWASSSYTTNLSNRFVCVLLGRGDGSFGPPLYLLSPGAPACFYDVAVGDLDQDGHPDALALDYSEWEGTNRTTISQQRIFVFTNGGDATFTTDAPQLVLEPEGGGPRAFSLAYVDEPRAGTNLPPGATLDLLVANRDSRSIDVFLNRGGLRFDPPTPIYAGDSPRDVAAGDLDGDGLADLVVVNRNKNTISILRGLGGGRFSTPVMELPTGVSPRQVVLADLDGDGQLDAAVNNRQSEDVSAFFGRAGLPGFLLSDAYYPAGFTPVSVVAEDFNGDGFPDVATANLRSHDVRVRLNRGDGTLSNELIYPVNFEPAFLATGDLNGDGHRDLIVTCLGSSPLEALATRGSLVTLLGRGDGTFGPAVASPLGNAILQPYWLRTGHLDGDGKLDAVVSSVRGSLVAFRGRGDGTFEPGVLFGLRENGRPLGFALGDFDRDGRLDVATSRGIVFLNDNQFFVGGTNGFDPSGHWRGRTNLFNSGTQAWAVEAEDLDNDGKLDLLVALTFVRPDPIGVLFGNGDGSFTQPTIYEGPDVGAVALAGVDMDGDGLKDIVIGNRCAATMIIYRGLGNRAFELREIVNTYAVEDLAVADLNRDGRPDLVAVGIGMWALLNGSTQHLATPRVAQVGAVVERSGLYINELMALNVQFLIVSNSTPDWIELYNHSAVTQQLAGWMLEQIDRDGTTKSWTFPDTNSLGPWDHLVVYCKKTPSAAPGLYAPFELSSEGETVVLRDAASNEVDRVSFPALPADVSYARFDDGARFFCLNPAPTPGAANLRPGNLDPVVERKDPYVGPGGSALGLTARVFDDVAIVYAAVCYRVAGQSNGYFTEIPLNDDGLHGDKLAGDGYYGAFLPLLPQGATIEYWLRAVDLEGQVAVSPDDTLTVAHYHHLTVPRRGSDLRLSEVVAVNSTGLRDERGQLEDWIELVNTGPTLVNLTGLALTKDYFQHSDTWYFPSNIVAAPGQRLVVFCDDDPRQGPLHATFKLLREGDRVFLVNADTNWTILDSLSFGWMPADMSYGILDGGTNLQFLAWPTPGAPNLPLPTPRQPGSPAAEIFYRRLHASSDGRDAFALRWLGNTNATYRVESSTNLVNWTQASAPPTHLGLGFYQWTDAATAAQSFYRVVRE